MEAQPPLGDKPSNHQSELAVATSKITNLVTFKIYWDAEDIDEPIDKGKDDENEKEMDSGWRLAEHRIDPVWYPFRAYLFTS